MKANLKLSSLLLVALAFLAMGCSKSLGDARTLESQGKLGEALTISLDHLEEDEAPVRIEALRISSRIGMKMGKPQSTKAGKKTVPLLQDVNKEVQVEAIKAVGRLQYLPAAPGLLNRLPVDGPQEEQAIASAFESMGTPAIKEVVTRLENGPNKPAVRNLLLKIGPVIAPALVKSMGRKSAAQNKDKFAILIELQSKQVPALIVPYVDDIELADMIKKGLVQLGAASVNPIIQALQTRKGQPDKSTGNQLLMDALGDIKSKKAIPMLETMAGDSDVLIRSAAENALVKIRGF